MNNYFNFEIPYFNEQFGSDWTAFRTIVNDNVDYVMNKTYELYELKDIGRMSVIATDIAISLRGIVSETSESLAIKKAKLRNFNKDFKSKGMKDTYLDYQELVVGTRGEIYSGYVFGSSIWDVSAWAIVSTPESTDRIWSTTETRFAIYVYCATTVSDELDEIVSIFRQDFLRPAFYQIYLIDVDFNILRTV